jgi:membrane-associated protein
VAGIGSMPYSIFLGYSIAGGILWIVSLITAGYFFGTIEIVKNNFSLVVLAIIFLSILPAIIEAIKHRRNARQ